MAVADPIVAAIRRSPACPPCNVAPAAKGPRLAPGPGTSTEVDPANDDAGDGGGGIGAGSDGAAPSLEPLRGFYPEEPDDGKVIVRGTEKFYDEFYVILGRYDPEVVELSDLMASLRVKVLWGSSQEACLLYFGYRSKKAIEVKDTRDLVVPFTRKRYRGEVYFHLIVQMVGEELELDNRDDGLLEGMRDLIHAITGVGATEGSFKQRRVL